MNLQRNSSSQKRKLKIGDIADILNVKKFVVRVWEKEFNLDKSGAGAYTEEDLSLFKKIKELMAQKVSVAEAKQFVIEYHAQQAQKAQEAALVEPVVAAKVVEAVQDTMQALDDSQDLVAPEETDKEERFFAAVEEVPVLAAVVETAVAQEVVSVECKGINCASTQKAMDKIAQLKSMIIDLQDMLG